MTHPAFEQARALPEPWRSHFPKSIEEAKEWKAITRHHALQQCVLAVMKTRIECAWAAYVMHVPGQDHDEEAMEVLLHGDKLEEGIARALFPEMREVRYAQ